MNKLKLRLDDLQVDTFQTTSMRKEKGTVYGRQEWTYDVMVCQDTWHGSSCEVSCFSNCDASCYDTCAVSCNGSCDWTCAASCGASCDGYTCPTAANPWEPCHVHCALE
jgi:hypothetical protein